MSVIIFIAGLVSGIFLEVKHEEYKDYKIERLEEILEVDEFRDSYFYEDGLGQVWAVGPGSCRRVL